MIYDMYDKEKIDMINNMKQHIYKKLNHIF